MKEFADPNRSDNAERFAEHQLKHGCDCGTSPCARQVSAIHADNAALRTRLAAAEARVAKLQVVVEAAKVVNYGRESSGIIAWHKMTEALAALEVE